MELNTKSQTRVYYLAALAVFVVGMIATFWGWRSARANIKNEQHIAIVHNVEQTEGAIGQQLNSYIQVLKGGAGLFRASDDVRRDEWKQYIDAFSLQPFSNGLLGLGYLPYVHAENIDQFVNNIRSQDSSDFNIYPAGQRSTYAPILYVETASSIKKPAIGFDMYSDPSRKEAIDKARDTGQISLTTSVALQKTSSGSSTTGFLIFIPVYSKGTNPTSESQRRQDIAGFTYGVFDMNVFLSSVMKSGPQNLAIEVYEQENNNQIKTIYSSANIKSIKGKSGTSVTNHSLQFQNQKLIIRYYNSKDILNNTQRQAASTILIIGVLSSSVVSGALLYVLIRRARRLELSKQYEVQAAKDDLLSLASHQLRTPATAVKQFIGMLLEGYAGKVTRQQKTMLTKAYTSNERQLETINQMLYVTRADAGKLNVYKTDFDINKTIREVIEEQKEEIEARDQIIVFKPKDKKLIVNADERLIYMTIENLINNASKYTFDRGHITVSSAIEKGRIAIKVKDTGVGIEESDMKKLFNKFSRIDNELSVQAGGSGIGLYLVRKVVHEHGGDIRVVSKPSKGTTFIVYLPSKRKIKSKL